MTIRRKKRDPFQFWALATYNAERSRGIVHSEEWQEYMRREQERFDAWAKAKYKTNEAS